MTAETPASNVPRGRLAIIGGGSSGLVSLKMAVDFLQDWEVICFEQSDQIIGCWGNPYPGFVSTSTRFTTQFACFPICGATVNDDCGKSREEFFRGGEYGSYLKAFAKHFELESKIALNCRVDRLQRHESGGWNLLVNGESRHFDAVMICTGLAARPKQLKSAVPQCDFKELTGALARDQIKNQRIVVIGGGESAVDFASRLAKPNLNNEVFLSLLRGVRVSPRYHPIRGVPSDFLRNRLMLSVHRDIRNWLGEVFVRLRVKYEGQFRRLFPSKMTSKNRRSGLAKTDSTDRLSAERLRRDWAFELTRLAKDDLFNMFHNKSDDFLEAVGESRIKIVGAAVDEEHHKFYKFGSRSLQDGVIEIQPDRIVPAIGYQSTVGELTNASIQLTDFYLGCVHAEYPDLYLIGYARPVIGNIPTISEMQARYVCGLISKSQARPQNIKHLLERELQINQQRFRNLNLRSTYPVEMIPYCDHLATLMGLSRGPRFLQGPIAWCRSKLSPASTMHYFSADSRVRSYFENAPVYMPLSLILFILIMKPIDWSYRLIGLWFQCFSRGDK